MWRLDGSRTTTATPLRVTWLLVGTDVASEDARALLAWLRPGSPRVRVGMVEGADEAFPEADLWIPRTARPEDLIAALHLAHQGFVLGTRAERTPLDRQLTGREAELLDALCAGLGNDRIAQVMGISRRTVEFHLTRIFRKLGVSSRAEAIVRAKRTG